MSDDIVEVCSDLGAMVVLNERGDIIEGVTKPRGGRHGLPEKRSLLLPYDQ